MNNFIKNDPNDDRSDSYNPNNDQWKIKRKITKRQIKYIETLESQRETLEEIYIFSAVIFFFLIIPWIFLALESNRIQKLNSEIDLKVIEYLEKNNITKQYQAYSGKILDQQMKDMENNEYDPWGHNCG